MRSRMRSAILARRERASLLTHGAGMSEQRTLAGVAYDTKGKATRGERFLREMDTVIP